MQKSNTLLDGNHHGNAESSTINDPCLLSNPYSLEVTLDKLRHHLLATKRNLALELLDKAINKANIDEDYLLSMENALLRGSTVELRKVFAVFGSYMARTSFEIPFYPHTDAVNGIDSAMFHIKFGDEQEAIDDYNFLHNRS